MFLKDNFDVRAFEFGTDEIWDNPVRLNTQTANPISPARKEARLHHGEQEGAKQFCVFL